MKCQRGFTLLELLLVVSILAAVAGIGTTVYFGGDGDGVEMDARRDLAFVEMARIAQAMRQFRDDTGYWPGQGPFSLPDYSLCGTTCTCSNVNDGVGSVGGLDPATVTNDPGFSSGLATGTLRDQFETPVYMAQLLRQPVICGSHPQASLDEWNEEAQRGWRGPYLTSEAYTDVSGGLLPNGSGNLALSGILAVRNVQAIADPFNFADPVPVSKVNVDSDELLVDWRTLPDYSSSYDVVSHEIGRLGTPYMIFGVDGCTPLRIVSAGGDGVYGGANYGSSSQGDYDPYGFSTANDKCTRHDVATLDDLRPAICANANTQYGEDDLVLCL
jgi:prepilin-type N-terminal cleavage/methylation domain-containing protein